MAFGWPGAPTKAIPGTGGKVEEYKWKRRSVVPRAHSMESVSQRTNMSAREKKKESSGPGSNTQNVGSLTGNNVPRMDPLQRAWKRAGNIILLRTIRKVFESGGDVYIDEDILEEVLADMAALGEAANVFAATAGRTSGIWDAARRVASSTAKARPGLANNPELLMALSNRTFGQARKAASQARHSELIKKLMTQRA